MTLLDTSDARNPTPYARDLAEQHTARRARFWPAPVKALPPIVTQPPVYAGLYDEAHRVLDDAISPAIDKQMAKAAEELAELGALRQDVRIKRIIALVARYHGITPAQMLSKHRFKEVLRPRHIAIYLSHELSSKSFPQIGRMFGGLDHSTVLSACRRMEVLIRRDANMAADVAALRARFETIGEDQDAEHPPLVKQSLFYRPPPFRAAKEYTRAEDAQLIALIRDVSIDKISEVMGRSVSSLQTRFGRLVRRGKAARPVAKAIIAGEGGT